MGIRAKWARYDALERAASSVLMAMDGDARRAEEAWMAASTAALIAFPEGSDEAVALSVVLAAVGRDARSVSA